MLIHFIAINKNVITELKSTFYYHFSFKRYVKTWETNKNFRGQLNPMKNKISNSLATGYKLNVHNTFRDVQDIVWMSYVRSIYVLYTRGNEDEED